MDHFNNLSYSEPFPQNLTFSMRFVTSNPTQVPKVKTVVNKCFSGLSAIFCPHFYLSANCTRWPQKRFFNDDQSVFRVVTCNVDINITLIITLISRRTCIC